MTSESRKKKNYSPLNNIFGVDEVRVRLFEDGGSRRGGARNSAKK